MSAPELFMIAATRGMLGIGIGMLVAERLGDRRRPIGTTLAIVGALATIPLALEVFGTRKTPPTAATVD
jgi:ABC-type nitrate/sulfonate/bicarbonate transport system permease component